MLSTVIASTFGINNVEAAQCNLAWDYNDNRATEFKLYSRPSATEAYTLAATIPAVANANPVRSHSITCNNNQQFILRASAPGFPESDPSNTLTISLLNPPSNLRVTITVDVTLGQ